jgi:DAK2 domain fusion protein YloV
VAEVIARAMVRGARGNSGVILSLFFQGFSKRLKGLREIDGAIFAEAAASGVESAYKAVIKPAEGSILTVSRVSAEKGLEVSKENNDPEFVISEMLSAAEAALEETVNQNPVLKKAGVIDAGGKGFCVMLDAMLRSLRGEELTLDKAGPAGGTKQAADFSEFETADIKYVYCTEYIINLENNESHEKLRAMLGSIGDSLVFVEDDDIIKIHLHTNQPGKALQEGLKYGSLSCIKIENMREQHTEKVILTGKDPVRPGERVIAKPEKKYGIVTVCAGEGISAVFRDIGADRIVEGGQTMNPSTEDILRAIDSTPAEIVIIFPNNKNIHMAAEQCVSMSEKTVVVMPTKSIPQGISALLNFDPELEINQNRERMIDAISMVRTGQITYATRDSLYDGKRIKQGDYLAILDGDLVAHNKLILNVVRKLARDIAKKPTEFLTIFYGSEVQEDEAEEVRAVFEKEFRNCEINMLPGGQPVYHYLISAE